MIEIEHLQRRFGPVTAVDDLSLTVRPGEVLGLLGPNGAGKTTTLRIVAGTLLPTAGRVRVFGRAVDREPLAVRRRLGYLPEGAPLWGEMSPAAHLDLAGRIHGLTGPERRRRSADLVERLDLGTVLHRPAEALSRGLRRRTALALALLHDPELLILDEPTDGLDPNQKQQVRDLVAGIAADRIVVVSTHLLEEVEAVCTRAALIHRGRLVSDGTPEALARRSRWHGALVLRLRETVAAAPLRAALGALPGVRAVEGDAADARRWTLFTDDGDAGRAALAALHAGQDAGTLPATEELFVHGGRLDDVFRALTA
jgi:ABC-2 type transport system ATP-binding protein